MTDATGCMTRWCDFVTLDENEFCEAYISPEMDALGNKYYRVYAFGESPFEYIWDNDMLEGDSVNIHTPGVYCVDVIDATGCQVTTCIEVLPPDSCYAEIDYTVGFAGDTILYIKTYENLEYKVIWDNGSTDHEITWDGNPVCAKIIFANGCTTVACFDGFPNSGKYYISGFVSDPVLDYLPDLDKVTFYHITSDSVVSRVRAEVKIIENTFFAELYDSGAFIIKADVEGYIPTYYKSVIHWQEATPVGVDDANVAVAYEIIMVREDAEDGIGIVTGAVIAVDNIRMALKTRNGDPLFGAEVILTTMEGKGLQAVYTDDQGNFMLEGIPYGTYYVVLEIPGLPQQRIEIQLTEDQPIVEDVVFEYIAEINDQTLSAASNSDFQFNLYPNPAKDIIEISMEGKTSGKSLIMIMDISGKIISSDQIVLNNQGSYRMDVSDLNSGNMYILMIQNNENIGMGKFFIAQ